MNVVGKSTYSQFILECTTESVLAVGPVAARNVHHISVLFHLATKNQVHDGEVGGLGWKRYIS
jgi:hypothetical protein